MAYTLRPYQAEAVARGVSFLRSGSGHGLIVAPTGSGKSLVIASIATQLDGRVLVFQPSAEILEQNATKLLAYGYNPAVYSASLDSREVGQITLATIGSVKSHPEMFDGVRYVLVDECHLVNAKEDKRTGEAVGMYGQFFRALGDVRILGLTATPYRLSTDGYGGSMLKFLTRTRPKVFSSVVHFTQIGDLMKQGYLVTPTYQTVSGFERKALQLNTTGADYTDDSVKRHFNRTGFADRLRRVVLRALEVGRRNVLVFTRFVDEAEALVQSVPGTAVVTADTKPKMRQAIVAGFRSGEIKVVANVGVLSIGFDYPELETVVLARPTASLALYYQQVGRLLRPHPEKADAWVIDMVDSVGYFGKVEDLWLRPGGKHGTAWELVTGDRVLTNVYFGQPRRRFVPGRGWSHKKRDTKW